MPTLGERLNELSSISSGTIVEHLYNIDTSGGSGSYSGVVLLDGLELEMEECQFDYELDSSPVDLEVDSEEYDIEVETLQFELEVC